MARPPTRSSAPSTTPSASPANRERKKMLQFGEPLTTTAGATPGLQPAARAPQPDSGAELRRVNVADKRVINGQTDVNQLVPFKYKWAWEKYLSACANQWMPQETQMSRHTALGKGP